MIVRYFRSSCTLLLLFLTPLMAMSAPSRGSGNPYFYEELGGQLFIFVAVATIVLAFVSLLRLLQIIIKVRELRIYQEQGLEAYLTEKELNKESWWVILQRRLTDAVPVEQEASVLTDHEYDGIRELDNNLPPWWLWMFYATTAFAFVYIFYYHFREDSISSHEAYAIEMEQSQRMIEQYLARQANLIDESNVTVLVDEQALAEGKAIFENSCATCHMADGGGGVGPNLTDDYWLHGGSIKDIFKTVKYGVPDKGMIAWKTQLRPSDIHKVASFIHTLRGTTPLNPKEPQGELYEAEESASDTTKTIGGLLNQK